MRRAFQGQHSRARILVRRRLRLPPPKTRTTWTRFDQLDIVLKNSSTTVPGRCPDGLGVRARLRRRDEDRRPTLAGLRGPVGLRPRAAHGDGDDLVVVPR